MLFRFKKFDIRQEKSAMKVGTDSVLLGCFCELESAETILDIGCGTGLLSLMAAQKSTAFIDAVELDDAAVEEARQNIASSSWAGRISLFHQRIQDYALQTSKTYDIIISNPPYYQANNNLSIDDLQRSKARHDQDLSFTEFIEVVVKLLNENGSCWVILPVAEGNLFAQLVSGNGLFMQTKIFVHGKVSKPANRVIMRFGKKNTGLNEKQFTIYNDQGEPTAAYIELTKTFYLWKQFDDDERLKV